MTESKIAELVSDRLGRPVSVQLRPEFDGVVCAHGDGYVAFTGLELASNTDEQFKELIQIRCEQALSALAAINEL